MNFARRHRFALLLIPMTFVISTLYVNCSPQVVFSTDLSSLSSNGFSFSYSVEEDAVLRDKLDAAAILSTINVTQAKVSYKLLGQPGNGKLNSFSAQTGEFEYAPKADFYGQDSFRIEIIIAEEGKVDPVVIGQVAHIHVLPVNDPPVLVQKEVGVASENGMTDVLIEATDVDDKDLRFEILGLSNNGSMRALGGGQFSYFPQCGFKGTEQVTVRVSDPHGASSQGVVTVRVTADSGVMTLSRTLAQDTVLNDDLSALSNRCVASGAANSMSVSTAPTKGAIIGVNASALSYTYKPNAGIWGTDKAIFLVKNGGFQKSIVVNYTITHVNKLPTLTKTDYETYQNSSLNITLQITDPDDTVVYSYLSTTKENKITTSLGGSLEKQTAVNEYLYIAPRGLKDVTDQFVVYLVDSSGQFVPFTVRVKILQNPIVTLKPGLAARGLSCTICHAQINANVITDFGHGSSFAMNVSDSGIKDPYWNRPVTVVDKRTLNNSSNIGVLEEILAWESGKILQTTHVPKATSPAGPSYENYLRSLRPKFYDLVTFPYGDTGDLLSGALGGYSILGGGSFGAVASYDEIYIGAPTVTDITNRMVNKNLTHEIQGAMQGLSWRSGTQKQYFTNTSSTVSCEGDIIVKGTVLLNSVNILTTNGCRIYATGPIFSQGPINIYAPSGDSARSNLQLSSAVAVMMGVGAEALQVRARDRLPTRGDTGGYNILSTVISEAGNLGNALQDAMRHSARGVAFSRLLLNAPQVHSRYNGVFRGTIIAEIALMSPGEFVYYFDDVFLNPAVEILPLLPGPSILKVK